MRSTRFLKNHKKEREKKGKNIGAEALHTPALQMTTWPLSLARSQEVQWLPLLPLLGFVRPKQVLWLPPPLFYTLFIRFVAAEEVAFPPPPPIKSAMTTPSPFSSRCHTYLPFLPSSFAPLCEVPLLSHFPLRPTKGATVISIFPPLLPTGNVLANSHPFSYGKCLV